MVMAVVLGFMRRYYPPSIRGLGYWAWMPVTWTVTAALFALPVGELPITRVLANGLLIGGFALFHVGCRRFFGQPSAWRRLAAGCGAALVGLAWFSWNDPSYALRSALVTIAVIAMHAATMWFLQCHGNRNFPMRMGEDSFLIAVNPYSVSASGQKHLIRYLPQTNPFAPSMSKSCCRRAVRKERPGFDRLSPNG